MFGLPRAFALAGARSLVFTLWDVGDLATSAWMAAFYEGLRGRDLHPSQAAREASRALLDRQRRMGRPVNPAEWGAFVAVGR
jgi:CHAT domain-containing protein